MNCKECFHSEICVEDINWDNGCPYYKDKALIVELPCKVGDTIYYIGFGHLCEYEVVCIDIHEDKIWIVTEIDYEDRHGFWSEEFGKTISLNLTDAETQLTRSNMTNSNVNKS